MDLRRELAKLSLRSVRRVVIIPIIVGALGTLNKKFEKFVKQLEIRQMTSILQKTCVRGLQR